MIIDDTITFGNYNWQVIDRKDERILIITVDKIEQRWYNNEFVEITWADCELRNYLDNEFFNLFNSDEKLELLRQKRTTTVCGSIQMGEAGVI